MIIKKYIAIMLILLALVPSVSAWQIVGKDVKKTARITTDGTTLNDSHEIIYCDTDSGGFTVTLPDESLGLVAGRTYRIVNVGTNILTINRNGNNIRGAASNIVLNQAEYVTLTYELTEGWW